MSDHQEGPGWWMASDGKWYPPESHPSHRTGTQAGSDHQEGEGWWMASDGRWYPPEAQPGPAAQAPAGLEGFTGYAGFWLRVVAAIIDGILVGVANAIIAGVLGVTSQDLGWSVISIAIGWGYYAGMESSSQMATVGKMALGLKVTDLAGQRIAFGRATGRYFGKWVSAIILMIGFLMAAFTAKKQALHDILASTLVLRAPR